jgi:hypothetical protein
MLPRLDEALISQEKVACQFSLLFSSDSATSSERRILEGYLWELSFKQIRTAEISCPKTASEA